MLFKLTLFKNLCLERSGITSISLYEKSISSKVYGTSLLYNVNKRIIQLIIIITWNQVVFEFYCENNLNKLNILVVTVVLKS